MNETAPDRESLIQLCTDGVVPERLWHDRDSADAQKQLGEALMLLRAGCEFTFSGDPKQTESMYWIRVTYRGFDAFEMGRDYLTTDLFYVPTRSRLDACAGKDWY